MSSSYWPRGIFLVVFAHLVACSSGPGVDLDGGADANRDASSAADSAPDSNRTDAGLDGGAVSDSEVASDGTVIDGGAIDGAMDAATSCGCLFGTHCAESITGCGPLSECASSGGTLVDRCPREHVLYTCHVADDLDRFHYRYAGNYPSLEGTCLARGGVFITTPPPLTPGDVCSCEHALGFVDTPDGPEEQSYCVESHGDDCAHLDCEGTVREQACLPSLLDGICASTDGVERISLHGFSAEEAENYCDGFVGDHYWVSSGSDMIEPPTEMGCGCGHASRCVEQDDAALCGVLSSTCGPMGGTVQELCSREAVLYWCDVPTGDVLTDVFYYRYFGGYASMRGSCSSHGGTFHTTAPPLPEGVLCSCQAEASLCVETSGAACATLGCSVAITSTACPTAGALHGQCVASAQFERHIRYGIGRDVAEASCAALGPGYYWTE